MYVQTGIYKVLIPILILLSSCSFGNPSIPSASEQNILPQSTPQASSQFSHVIWGLFDISIDPESGDTNVIPNRVPAGHLNARKFLEETPCSSCLILSNAYHEGGKEWTVDIQIRHPFTGLDLFTGFDVRGIVMFDPTYEFPGSGLAFPDPDDESGGALLNPEGYTDLFNPVTYPPGSADWPAWEYQQGKYATPVAPVSTLNPFINYNTATPRRYFGCSAADTQTFNLRFPADSPLHFGYAIDACWAPPLFDPPSVPDDFPLAANRPEPFHLGLEIITNTLWSEPGIGGGGIFHFILKVYDHQDPHLVANGGTIDSFMWEIPGMTGWVEISPLDWSEGTDSLGSFVAYFFNEAPVPDNSTTHKMLIGIQDTEAGLLGVSEKAFIVTDLYVASGETCWSPGELLSDEPSENYQAYLNNGKAIFLDDEGILHVYFADYNWQPHHITCLDGLLSDEIILPGERAFNLNAVRDTYGGIHFLYADNPPIMGGDIVYRYQPPDGDIGPAVVLTTVPYHDQFQPILTIAPDDTMLAVWMDSNPQPNRSLCASYYNGIGWTPEMTLKVCYLPGGWVGPTMVVDSNNVFHIVYNSGEPQNLRYMQLQAGSIILDEPLVEGDWDSVAPIMSIGPDDRLYLTFLDKRYGGRRGFFSMRDPVTGDWSDPIDMVGFNHANNRYQNCLLPDNRLAVIWLDWRDGTRGLYSKIFDPFLSEEDIQSIPDDEVDAPFAEIKNQTRLTVGPDGTLHLVWNDRRPENHWQLFYSQCTP